MVFQGNPQPYGTDAGHYAQGSGKGAVDKWVAVVKKGKIMFEIGDIDEATAREALRLAANKLPIKTKFVKKESGEK